MSDKKTPWNPSKSATKRVKHPLPAPTECPCCTDWLTDEPSIHIEIVSHEDLYGEIMGEWPWVYQCMTCEAYVGLHPFTNIPLGTLADGPIRQARKTHKQPFESLWVNGGKLSRREAYSRLAEKLGIKIEVCHFAMFDVGMCEKAAQASREIFLEILGGK
tara:strand:- start:22 stop:501 length:480 start_codon:yes stop_codon:yes gene_type:complete